MSGHNNMTMEERVAKSHEVIAEAYKRFPVEDMRVAFTGGKDSTLLAWLVYTYAQKEGLPMPKCLFINEGSIFDEIHEFKDWLAEEWGLTIDEVHNSNVSQAAGGVIGAPVRVADLDERNQMEVARLGYKEETFPYEPESYVGNHLMKTVAMNRYLEAENVKAVFVGIRHDEQSARANETYFSARQGPDHTRVHPILHYKEADVWTTIHGNDVPYVKLYEQGYRSLGAKVTTTKTTDVPAWEQDLENTIERQGRRQDKEGIMERLRALGYM
ncbi:MAG: phosphoadenosine phosphosulfate reductase family protein [Chloroflexota bacterium]